MAQIAGQVPGNPSSLHWAGRAARRVVDDARDALAAAAGVEPGSVVFTSGGTEANNIAIFGWASQFSEPGRIVTSAIEHPSILKPLQRLEAQGWEVIRVRPKADGVVDAAAIIDVMNEKTELICLMAANNETGAVQPVQQVAEACRERKVALLVDAVQSFGKTSLNLGELGADFISLSAHKIGGPKGVGALLVRRGIKIPELSTGGGQERGRRSGTENVPGIAGFATALGKIDFEALRGVRDHFERILKEAIPEVQVFSENVERLGNTSMFGVPGMDGETLLMQLDLAGFAVASGSACSSGKRDASHVLLAMGVSKSLARGSVRASFGPGNTLEDAEALVEELAKVRGRLRAMAGVAA